VQMDSDPARCLYRENSTSAWRGDGFTDTIKPNPPGSRPHESFPLDRLCCHTQVPAHAVSDLNIPAVSPGGKPLRTQNNMVTVEPLWVLWELVSPSMCHTGQVFRKDQFRVSRVWIQSHSRVADNLLHLAPDIEAKVAQMFSYIYQSS
ncbi:hypothetical protein GOODEAATRI_030770, partial [Goodea atripinnis]